MVELIRNVLPTAMLNAVRASWPDTAWSGWHRYQGTTADKYGSLHHSLIPPACAEALRKIAAVVNPVLPADSFIDYELHAAGMHQIPPGGFLGRHLDAERHPLRPWRRTHSIVYFVDSISPEHGGALYVEDPYTTVQPEANAIAIFATSGAWHGVAKTKSSAPWRRTLALFAWSLSSSDNGKTSAFFQEHHNEDSVANHNRADGDPTLLHGCSGGCAANRDL